MRRYPQTATGYVGAIFMLVAIPGACLSALLAWAMPVDLALALVLTMGVVALLGAILVLFSER